MFDLISLPSKDQLKSFLPYAASALLLSLLLTFFSFHPPLRELEKRLLDVAFQIRGIESIHPDIVIVAVTDDSLKRIAAWPWPRKFHATLMNILRSYQPAVVFFDMIFSEKSNPLDDEAFAASIKKAGNVVLSYYFEGETPNDMIGKTPAGMPIDLFKQGALDLGYTNIFPDSDGHIREIVLRHQTEDQSYLHVSLATAAHYLKWTKQDLSKIPADKNMIINFPGPYPQFQIVPYERLIWNSQFSWYKPFLESLKGKIILVGHTATGTAMDLKATAFSRAYPGVGLLASMIHTILTKHFIQRIPWQLQLLVIFILSLCVMVIVSHHKPLLALLYTLGIICVFLFSSQLIFQYLRWWVPCASALIGITLTHMIMTLMDFIRMHFQREMMLRELSLAARIQKNLLPTEMPTVKYLAVAALSDPARHVGGDLYDLLSLPDGKFGICIGDVSGKGVPAALFMARTLSEFRREAGTDPSLVLTNLNKKLTEGGFSGLFVTVLYLVVDHTQNKVTFANGGHEPLFFYQKRTHQVLLLKTDSGAPLGIDAESVYDQKWISVETGDIILLESDGIKEAMNLRKELFGFEKIQQAILEVADKTPNEILAHVEKRVLEFVKNAPQHDDMTMVCAKFI